MEPWIVIIALVVPFVPRFVFWLLGKLFPLEQPSGESENVAELRGKYRKWLVRGFWLWLMLTPPTAGAMWLLLIWLAEAQTRQRGEAMISLLPDGLTWALPAFFFGLLATVFPADLILRIILRGRYREFDRWQELEFGWNGEAMTRWLYPVLGGLWLLFAAAILNWYVVLGEKEIRINAFFSPFEQVYRYEELTAIRTAPRFVAPLGNEVESREYVFSFQDGGAWSTRWSPKRFIFGPTDLSPRVHAPSNDNGSIFHLARKLVEAGNDMGFSAEDKRRVAQWISEKSGVPITELDVLR